MVSMTLFKRSTATALCVATFFAAAAIAQPAPDFQPTVGQRGKDVVWVPSPQALVDRMLDMARLTPEDVLIDLGSGDGRTVITAAKRGARATGIEYNPDMVELARANAQKEGVADKASFEKADLFETDFSRANVLTLFLLPDINRRLRPRILDMKAGARVVSNTFDMGDWTPDEIAEAGGNCTSYCRALFWIVPAKVAGAWKTPDGELTLEQTYQMIAGQVKTGNVIAPITAGKVTGESIAFTAGGKNYSGRISDGVIEGVVKSGAAETRWRASRAP